LNDATVTARLRRTAGYQKAGKQGRANKRAALLEPKKPTAGIYKPLVDTGFLMQTCTYEVGKK
jgi:hypothetical protein